MEYHTLYNAMKAAFYDIMVLNYKLSLLADDNLREMAFSNMLEF